MHQTQIFIDNRGPLGSLRRTELAALAKKHGVPVSEDDPAWKMREALRAKDIVPEAEPEPEPVEDLLSLHLFDLRKICKERNIPFNRTDGKVVLLAKLGA